MNILSIETSCDETAVSILQAEGDFKKNTFKILGDALFSQADIHKRYGGVYPNLAKREHGKNLVPLLKQTLQDAQMLIEKTGQYNAKDADVILEREVELKQQFADFIQAIDKPAIDAMSVTHGPGLEPALWVGINFAKALSVTWNIPVIPINHMEGHIFSSLLKKKSDSEFTVPSIDFPSLSLLISGGHTEIIYQESWSEYNLAGQTQDDAVGEAFDKVARMLGLPYPGGPEISKLSEQARKEKIESSIKLPRPMIRSDNCHFSFSGLKTAVLYALRDLPEITEQTKKEFAREFEDAVSEILITKVKRAIGECNAKTLIVGGGVAANSHIRNEFQNWIKNEYPDMTLFIPPRELTTDNAIMIGIAGYFRYLAGQKTELSTITADGNLKLAVT